MSKVPRNVRLTPTGASLGLYHAALSDPFSSPATFIPFETRPGTYVHKRLLARVSPSVDTSFRIEMKSAAADEWGIDLYSGTSHLTYFGANPGHARIVGAAIRVTDIGQADTTGGLATLRNTHSETTFDDHKTHALYRKSVTAYYKPVFATDYLWFGGNAATANDGYGGYTRTVSVTLDPAVATKSFVEYAVIFESDSAQVELEGAGNYMSNRRARTHDAGAHAKRVARHSITNMKQRPIDMHNHSHVRGPSHIHRVIEGVKASAETGATVAGVAETLRPGTVSSPFARFLGLGEATEAELATAAGEAIPMFETAGEFLPLLLF